MTSQSHQSKVKEHQRNHSNGSFQRGTFHSSSLNKLHSFNINNRSRAFKETNYNKYLSSNDSEHQMFSSCSSINENIIKEQKTNDLFLLPPRPISSSRLTMKQISPSAKSITSNSMDNMNKSIATTITSGIASGSTSSLFSSSISPRCTSPNKTQVN